jgi:hypothetical protein
MVMVRDAETGDVLSIGRERRHRISGGATASGDRLQVLLSDGVTSRAW